MFSAFPATDLPCNQSAGFVWLKWFGSNGVLASLTGSPFNLILPDSMAISSLSWTREAICKPHLFLGPEKEYQILLYIIKKSTNNSTNLQDI